MKRIFPYLFAISSAFAFIHLVSCSSDEAGQAAASDTLQVNADSLNKIKLDSLKSDSLGVFFAKYNVIGSFLMFDPQKGKYYVHRKSWHKQPFSPASTFKIVNALIALETGAIPDTSTIIKWNGKQYPFESWNQDHTMGSAMRASAVWYYQEVARRIGEKRMQHYLNTLNYGNHKIGDTLDSFWLNNTLQITMEDQVALLRNLYREELPGFSRGSILKVKKMLVLEETPDYILSGKTGWSTIKEPNMGWFVGYLMRKNNTGYYFALLMEMPKPEEHAVLRKQIAMEILKHLHLTDPLPKPAPADSTKVAAPPALAPKKGKP